MKISLNKQVVMKLTMWQGQFSSLFLVPTINHINYCDTQLFQIAGEV